MKQNLSKDTTKIGDNLVSKGYLKEKNLHVVLLRQEYGDTRLFGQIATSLHFISSSELEQFFPSTD